MKKKILIVGLIGLLTLGVGGGIFAANQNTNAKLNISEDEAKKIALDSVGSGEVLELELDDEDGTMVYEIDIKSENKNYELEINADDGKILENEIDDEDDDEIVNEDVKLTEDEAIKIAEDTIGQNSSVVEVELEKENGKIVYDIELKQDTKEFDLEIDANTGEVLSQEEDND